MQHYRHADLSEEKLRILRSLASIKDKELKKQVLEYSLTDEVKSQDSAELLISVALTKDGRELAWEFFKKNWEIYQTRFPVIIFLFVFVLHPVHGNGSVN